MSDDWIRLIPCDPTFVPRAQDAEHARSVFASHMSGADEVTATFTEATEFIDAGVNMSQCRCPECGTPIDPGWWDGQLQQAGERAFVELSVTFPDCDHRASLDDLDYDWPVGFARFVLNALNPQATDLEVAQRAEIASILGTPVRIIWQHL